MHKVKVIAFDLDGTLCQHRSPLPPENIETLNRLGKRYKLLMVGAGQCGRIFRQTPQSQVRRDTPGKKQDKGQQQQKKFFHDE